MKSQSVWKLYLFSQLLAFYKISETDKHVKHERLQEVYFFKLYITNHIYVILIEINI